MADRKKNEVSGFFVAGVRTMFPATEQEKNMAQKYPKEEVRDTTSSFSFNPVLQTRAPQ